MKAMQNVWGRRAAASGLALLMAAALPVTALADGPGAVSYTHLVIGVYQIGKHWPHIHLYIHCVLHKNSLQVYL